MDVALNLALIKLIIKVKLLKGWLLRVMYPQMIGIYGLRVDVDLGTLHHRLNPTRLLSMSRIWVAQTPKPFT